MAELAVGLGLFQFGRIIGLNPVDTFIIDVDYFLMRKILLGKRRLDVAFGGAVDIRRHRIMGQLGNSGVAVVAGHIFMQAVGINSYIDVIIMPLAVFVDSTDKAVLVALQTFFLVQSHNC